MRPVKVLVDSGSTGMAVRYNGEVGSLDLKSTRPYPTLTFQDLGFHLEFKQHKLCPYTIDYTKYKPRSTLLVKMDNPSTALPRVTISFCTQCKWMLRAAYVSPIFTIFFIFWVLAYPDTAYFLASIGVPAMNWGGGGGQGQGKTPHSIRLAERRLFRW